MTKYIDIDFNFIPHPVTKDLRVLTGSASIKQSIRNLVNIRAYEIPYKPEIACNVASMLFQIGGVVAKAQLKSIISNTLKNYEPRIQLINVLVTEIDRGFDIIVLYNEVNKSEVEEVKIFLDRLK